MASKLSQNSTCGILHHTPHRAKGMSLIEPLTMDYKVSLLVYLPH